MSRNTEAAAFFLCGVAGGIVFGLWAIPLALLTTALAFWITYRRWTR